MVPIQRYVFCVEAMLSICRRLFQIGVSDVQKCIRLSAMTPFCWGRLEVAGKPVLATESPFCRTHFNAWTIRDRRFKHSQVVTHVPIKVSVDHSLQILGTEGVRPPQRFYTLEEDCLQWPVKSAKQQASQLRTKTIFCCLLITIM